MTQSFADHHRFRESELEGLAAIRRRFAARLVTTEKDAARIGARMAAYGVDVLPVSLVFDAPETFDSMASQALTRGARGPAGSRVSW
jgi:tetraacyldisaccharide 4'-kinase